MEVTTILCPDLSERCPLGQKWWRRPWRIQCACARFIAARLCETWGEYGRELLTISFHHGEIMLRKFALTFCALSPAHIILGWLLVSVTWPLRQSSPCRPRICCSLAVPTAIFQPQLCQSQSRIQTNCLFHNYSVNKSAFLTPYIKFSLMYSHTWLIRTMIRM